MLLSTSCVLCGASTKQKISLCKNCQNDLPLIKHACGQCGLPLESSAASICGQCITVPPVVDYTLSLYHYESPIDYLISQLKYNQQLSSAAILGFLLKDFLALTFSQAKSIDLPEIILPVPLHEKRLVKRGFNQSLEIARPVAKGLGVALDYKLAQRTRPTMKQTKLNAKQRKKNIKGCFELATVPAYRHIVLIDDVVTTGSTTNELAQVLKNAGVEKVGVWSVARATLK